jgi:hypothetical protein
VIKIKHSKQHPQRSARVYGMQTPILLAIMIAAPIFEQHGVDLVITSGMEGRHGLRSSHYIGYAVDFRSREIPTAKRAAFTDELQDALGPDYQVINESTHFHVQFRPSTGYKTDER